MNSIKSRIIVIVIGALLHVTASVGQNVQGIKIGNYFQEIKTDIQLPQHADSNVIGLFKQSDKLIVVCSNGVFQYQNSTWAGEPFGSGWQTTTLDSKGAVWVASVNTLQKAGDKNKVELPEFARKDSIISLFWENDKTLLVATNNGLLTWDGTWKVIPFTKGKRINAIARDASNILWLATNDGLLNRINSKWFNLDDHLMADGLNRLYFSLESRKEQHQVLFGAQFSIGCIAENGDNWVASGDDGLPFGPATSIHSSAKTIWLGTQQGAIKKDDRWHYYNGKRWLPNNKVNDILIIDDYTVWIATPEGISQIKEVEMTLNDKATVFEERIKKRHDRYGLVSPSKLVTPGDLSTSQTINNDNDGLWTSIYLAAECFRFGVTNDQEAKKNAIRAYEALERLETVTGISGLPARTFAAATDHVTQSRSPHPKLWHPSSDGKWQWMDDTSSDEVAGHLFAVALFYDLVADGEMKDRARNLVHRVMTHIIDNNFQLIDYDGLPTKWAIWNPDSLNIIPGRWYERGLNSLQILSFLKTASHITHDQKFEKAYQLLVQKHHYAENAVQSKMYGPFENSYSDDILMYLPYYNLFRYAGNDTSVPLYIKSLERSWRIAKDDHIPLWNVIASAALKRDCDLQYAVDELQQVPMDLISWSMKNSHRWDLQKDQVNSRGGNAQAVKKIPAPEGGISKWNTNPHQFDTGTNGDVEDDGAYFLLPYWMGRYHRFFIGN